MYSQRPQLAEKLIVFFFLFSVSCDLDEDLIENEEV